MADFSIGDALGSGFGLIGRRPFSVLAWGLVYLLLGLVLPFGLMAGVVGPDLVDFVSSFHPGMVPPTVPPAAFAPLQAKIMLVEPVLLLAPAVVQAVLAGAVFRAVLEPRNRGLAYMRLGRREFWLAVVLMVAGILAMMLMMLFELGGLVCGLILNIMFDAQHVDWTIRVPVYVGLALVLLAIFLGICVRFSLAAPMSFAESHFRLFESWPLTRGRGWKLFGLGLLVALVSGVLILLVEGVLVGAVMAGVGATHFDWSTVPRVLQPPGMLADSGLAWWLAAAVLIFALAMGAVFAIVMAPWAVVYRELSATKPPSPREGGSYEPLPPLMPPEPDLSPLSEASHDHGHADPHAGVSEDGHDDHDGRDQAQGLHDADDHGHGEADDGDQSRDDHAPGLQGDDAHDHGDDHPDDGQGRDDHGQAR